MKLTTKALAVAVCVGTMSSLAWGQNPPAFRTVNSGNWNDLATWQQQNPMVPGGWGTPDHLPGAADGQITIQPLHVVWIRPSLAEVTADELVVQGMLVVENTLTIVDGPTVNDISVTANGYVVIESGGRLSMPQSEVRCNIGSRSRLQVQGVSTQGSIESNGHILIDGTLELDGFMTNLGEVRVNKGGVFMANSGSIDNSIGILWVLCDGTFRMERPGVRIFNGNEVLIEGGFIYTAGCATGNPFNYEKNCHTLRVDGTPPDDCNSQNIFTAPTNDKLRNVTNLSSLDIFWPTTAKGPANVIVGGNFTLNSPRTISGSFQCGGRLELGAPLTVTGTTNITGTIQINPGGGARGNNFVYSGFTSSLVLNFPAGSIGDSANVFWPNINGPRKVFVRGAGGMTLNVPRTVEELYAYVPIISGNNLTVNKLFSLQPGGFITGAPTYLSGSTLAYVTGGTYARGDEWSATSGAGYPANVEIGNKTILNYPNGSTAAGAISGDLNIANGSALYMDFDSIGVGNPLTIGGSVTCTGALSLGDAPGGDLSVGGNWSVGENFKHNSRTVVFNGSTEQKINSATTFEYLTIDNPAGVRLDNNVTVSQKLTFTKGNFITPYILTLSGEVQGASKASHVVTLRNGYIARPLSPGDRFQFPIGGSAASYNPITIAHTGVGAARTFYTQVRDSSTVGPQLPGGALRRVWGFSFSGVGGINVTVTLQWETDDPAGPQFNPGAGVAIGRYDASLTKWIETAATYDPGPPRRATASFATTGGEFFIGNLGAFTSVAEQKAVPQEFALYQNAPNPFNPSTTIRYAIPHAGDVTLKVYDLVGNEIETLVNEKQPAGEHSLRWNPVGLSSGVYFYRLQVEGSAPKFVATKKLILLQ